MGKSKPGISKLLTAMRKLVVEINDQEICRRLEILMNSEKEDLPALSIKRLMDDPASFDARSMPEPYTQYVRHFIYMHKRHLRESHREKAASKNNAVKPRGAAASSKGRSKRTTTKAGAAARPASPKTREKSASEKQTPDNN